MHRKNQYLVWCCHFMQFDSYVSYVSRAAQLTLLAHLYTHFRNNAFQNFAQNIKIITINGTYDSALRAIIDIKTKTIQKLKIIIRSPIFCLLLSNEESHIARSSIYASEVLIALWKQKSRSPCHHTFSQKIFGWYLGKWMLTEKFCKKFVFWIFDKEKRQTTEANLYILVIVRGN